MTRNNIQNIAFNHINVYWRFPTSNRDRLFYHALLRCDVENVRRLININQMDKFKTINIVSKSSRRSIGTSGGFNITPLDFFYQYVISNYQYQRVIKRPYHKIVEIFQVLIENSARSYKFASLSRELYEKAIQSFSPINEKVFFWKLLSIYGIDDPGSTNDLPAFDIPDYETKYKNLSNFDYKTQFYLLITSTGDDITSQYLSHWRFRSEPKIVRTNMNFIRNVSTGINSKLTYNSLKKILPKLADNVEWFDHEMYASQVGLQQGEWFYNTRDKNIKKEIVRVFDKSLLEKMNKNPFTRQDWTLKNLARFSINGGSGKNNIYHIYNKRKYVVRVGPRGGRYILNKGEKLRIK